MVVLKNEAIGKQWGRPLKGHPDEVGVGGWHCCRGMWRMPSGYGSP